MDTGCGDKNGLKDKAVEAARRLAGNPTFLSSFTNMADTGLAELLDWG